MLWICVIDFEAGGNPLSYHFANDGHWNEAGHRTRRGSSIASPADVGIKTRLMLGTDTDDPPVDMNGRCYAK